VPFVAQRPKQRGNAMLDQWRTAGQALNCAQGVSMSHPRGHNRVGMRVIGQEAAIIERGEASVHTRLLREIEQLLPLCLQPLMVKRATQPAIGWHGESSEHVNH
jgi:hypothetical protein